MIVCNLLQMDDSNQIHIRMHFQITMSIQVYIYFRKTTWMYHVNIYNLFSLSLQTVRNDPVGQAMFSAHMRVDGHPHINPVEEVIVGESLTYLIFPPCHVDLHSYVRMKRRLREPTARALFRQIVSAVHEAHSKGIVLRDLKLRKFVFTDETR